MIHPDKNALITFYYQEYKSSEQKKKSLHINSCHTCQEYLQTINKVESKLVQFSFEEPLPQAFENIKSQIFEEASKKVAQPQPVFIKPVLNIAYSLMGILMFVYFIQSKITLLPIWESLSQFWIINTIGSFGFVLIIFFCICVFTTLSFAPILIMQKKENQIATI